MENKENKENIESKLKDKVFVNYNILVNLEEIKKIMLSNNELLRYIAQKLTKEEQKEGVFKSK